MIERKIKILIMAHIFGSIWFLHWLGLMVVPIIYAIARGYVPIYFLYFFSSWDLLLMLFFIVIIVFSLAIAYHLYRSNKEKYHKISIMNILFCSILFLFSALFSVIIAYLSRDFYLPAGSWERSPYFHSFVGVPGALLFCMIPAIPSIFTIRYANKNKLELRLILFLILGFTLIAMGAPVFLSWGAPVFLSWIGTIPYIHIYLLWEDNLVCIALAIIFSLVSMIIGVILAIKGAVGLSKKQLGTQISKG